MDLVLGLHKLFFSEGLPSIDQPLLQACLTHKDARLNLKRGRWPALSQANHSGMKNDEDKALRRKIVLLQMREAWPISLLAENN